jgi:photosystem II stability/assembly factor-like uncharacterized protein
MLEKTQGPKKFTTDAFVEGMVNPQTIGAVNRVLPHPTDSNIMYIGSVNGGVWKTTNALSNNPSWLPLTDNLKSLSIGALAFDTADTTRNTIIAGVGRTSSLYSRGGPLSGLQISTNGGTTFTEVDGSGRLSELSINGVVKHGNTIVVTVDKSYIWYPLIPNYGVFRSTDNGATFTPISTSDIPHGRAADMVIDPANPTTIYVAIYNLAAPLVGGGRGGIYKSTDTGATWNKISTPEIELAIPTTTRNIKLATSILGRVYVAIAVAATTTTKAGQLSAIFRSQDSGNSWNALSLPTTTENGVQYGIHPGGQGFVHFSFEADPINPDILYIGGDRQPSAFGGTNRNVMPSIYYTPGASDTPNTDSKFPNSIGAIHFTGRLFRGNALTNTWVHLTHSNTLGAAGGGTASNSSPHADSRDMAFDASGNLIQCDDGGVYRRTLPQSNMGDWYSINGDLQVTEMHSIVYDPITQLITGGTQDNGTMQQENPNSMTWSLIEDGDGGKVCIDTLVIPGLSVLYFSTQYLGYFQRKTYNSSKSIINKHTITLTNPNFKPQFYTPIKVNSVVGGRLLLAGETSVYESFDMGDTLIDIGGGLLGNCSCIAYGGMKNGIPNPNVVYACKDNNVYLRTSSTQTLTLTPASLPNNNIINDIAIDSTDWERAFVVTTIVTTAGLVSHIYMTTDAGTSWIDITGNLSNVGEIRSNEIIRHTTFGFGGIVVGTEYGVYLASDNSFGTWTKIGTNIPNVQIESLDYNPEHDILVIGTFGRGAWSISNIYSNFYMSLPSPIISINLRATQGSNIYEQPISSASIGNNSIHITNTDLINALNNEPNGTIFSSSIVVTYENSLYSLGNEVVVENALNYVT